MVYITREVRSYTFDKPQCPSEREFNDYKNSMPIRPHINTGKELMKEYGSDLAFRSIFFMFPTGTFSSAFNYYKVLRKQKKFYEGLFEAIFSSSTYDDFCKKFDEL